MRWRAECKNGNSAFIFELFPMELASLRLKTMSLNIAQQFMKEMVKIYFGLSKIQVKFLINWSLGVF